MSTLKALMPGKRGSRDLLARRGASLLDIRDRRVEVTGQRLKTVEWAVPQRDLVERLDVLNRVIGGA